MSTRRNVEDRLVRRGPGGGYGSREQTAMLRAQLEDVAGILRVRAADLDVDYVERWVTELGLAEQWQRARALAPA